MFLSSPSAWLNKYGFGYREETNARMSMGLASEAATWHSLMQKLTDSQTSQLAMEKFDELREGEIAPEREYSGQIAIQFVKELRKRKLDIPLTYQSKKIVDIPDLNKQVIGFTDLGYDDLIVDLKATLRCPTSITGEWQAGSVRQQAVYSILFNKPVALLYGTPQKSAFFKVPQELLDRGWETMLGAWKRIEKIDNLCATAEEATEIIPLNPDSFYWKQEPYQQALKQWR
jgi:hypothetical protein